MPRPLSRRGGFAYLPLILTIVLLCLLWWFRAPILGWFGTFLDTSQPPQKAELAVVLAGGWTGERVLLAGKLVKEGFVPRALLSDPQLYYEASECELARNYAARRGFPSDMFECATVKARSTREEVIALAAELKRRGVRKILLVSVNTHLRRAEMLFRKLAPDIEVHPAGAESPLFQLKEWYGKRDGQKAVFLEWLKLITTPFGL